MNQLECIIKAREQLERAAPLGLYDCGKICSAACCKGDENTGMWLFPGEEKLFENNTDFQIKATEGNFGYPMVVCSGKCNRQQRPISCRIYPFFFYIEKNVRVIKDIRAINSCPLVNLNIEPDKKFLRSMRKAAKYLIRDEEIFEYIKNLQNELDEIVAFNEKIKGMNQSES